MTFGLMLVPMAAMIGLAVDFGRVYAVNSSTQGALDAAALAAGRVAQVETDNMIAKRRRRPQPTSTRASRRT